MSAMRCLCVLQTGHDVLGSYMSPVNDAYWKQALAPGRDRVRMCQLATADSGGGGRPCSLFL
jgi:nicotinamide mononucleotide adenylyltransferase